MAGLLDGRRPMTHPPYSFAPFGDQDGRPTLSPFYAARMKGKRVLIVDDVRNTGTTFKRCADSWRRAGGTVIGTMQIIDRCEACVSLDVPNVSLVEYKAPPNYSGGVVPDVRGRRAGHGLLIADDREDVERHRDEQQVLKAEQHRAVFGEAAEHRARDVGAERAIGLGGARERHREDHAGKEDRREREQLTRPRSARCDPCPRNVSIGTSALTISDSSSAA